MTSGEGRRETNEGIESSKLINGIPGLGTYRERGTASKRRNTITTTTTTTGKTCSVRTKSMARAEELAAEQSKRHGGLRMISEVQFRKHQLA